MNTQEIKVGSFNANYPVNELKHSLVNRDIVEKHSEKFINKIEEFGWLSPIVIDDRGNIIEGHHRALSAEKLNLKTIPAYIIDWVDTDDLNEYQKYIISLNNANRNWSALDYLKSFSRNKKQYSFVFDKYNKTNNVFSVGNVLNIYFNCGTSQQFKDGKSFIKNLDFSNYLFENLLRLKSKYGGVKFQAFTINRLCSFSHQKIKDNKKEMDFIFKQLESLAKNDSPLLSSVEKIRPWLNEQLTIYRTK
tara:strand:- start:673 stop:1416 length:744 start_codon:yes stop_codon:yes gene_type:complete